MADVKLKHPSAKRQITVRADMAALYESQGWQRVETTPPAKKATSGKS